MENKKGSIGVVIGVSLVVVFLISVVVLVYVLNTKGFFKPHNEDQIATIPLYIMPRDAGNQNSTEANYILEYKNEKGERIVVSEGLLDSSWNELIVPRDYLLTFYCWNNDHYVVKAMKNPATGEEIKMNKSTFTCDMVKMGNLTISHTGDFSKIMNTITLDLSDQDWYYKTGLCFAWSSGIIDVSLKNQLITCDSGSWKNFSSYDEKTKEYTWLTNNTYMCGDSQEVCEFVEANKCKVANEETPERMKGKVDSCVYTGKSFHNETFSVDLEVRTAEYKNSLDYIDIYVYDSDRRWNPMTGSWDWLSELNKQDLGVPDQVYRINYEEDCSNDVCTV